MALPITAVDIALGNIELIKVVVHRRSDIIVAFFRHTKYPKKNVFTATIKFYMRDEGKWVTNLKIYEAPGVIVADDIKERLESQLAKTFSPYFDHMMEGLKPW